MSLSRKQEPRSLFSLASPLKLLCYVAGFSLLCEWGQIDRMLKDVPEKVTDNRPLNRFLEEESVIPLLGWNEGCSLRLHRCPDRRGLAGSTPGL